MRNLFLLCAIIFGMAASAAGKTPPAKPTCARVLGVPEEYAAQVNIYTDLRFVAPLNKVSFENHNPGHLSLKLSDKSGMEIEIMAYQEEDSDTLVIDDEKIGSFIPREYAWRIAMAHLLPKFPSAKKIRYMFFGDDYDDVRNLLAQGLASERAVRQSPTYRAMSAFGFVLESVDAEPYPEDKSGHAGATQLAMTLKRKK